MNRNLFIYCQKSAHKLQTRNMKNKLLNIKINNFREKKINDIYMDALSREFKSKTRVRQSDDLSLLFLT